MSMPLYPDPEFERRVASRLMDVLIRAGLIVALAALCYRVFSPFLTLMVWALILAIAMYPLHLAFARRMRNRQGFAATLLVLIGIVLLVVPAGFLVSLLGDSVQQFVERAQDGNLEIPAPYPAVEGWPLVGKKLHALWSTAHADLPALIQSQQAKIGDLAKTALAFVASIGGGLLGFLASFIIAGIIMAFGESGERAMRSIFRRVFGTARGEEFATLSTQTIRAVANGVIGVAFIQAIIIGLVLVFAGVPFTGVLTVIVLVLGIAQVPALIVTLPVIGYIWASGNYETAAAMGYTVLLVVSGMADNVLKPLLLGRGVEAPMPVILLGALGGMATAGILGMFVGATLLALGYQLFMSWVASNPDGGGPAEPINSSPAG